MPFVSVICSRQFPRRAVLLLTPMKRLQLRAKQQSYLQPDIWGSEAVRQSGRDSLHSHHIPTESWEDSGRPCSEIPLIHRSDKLKERRWISFIRWNSGFTSTNLQREWIVQKMKAAWCIDSIANTVDVLAHFRWQRNKKIAMTALTLFHIHTFVYKCIYFVSELSVHSCVVKMMTKWSIACQTLQPKSRLFIV